MKLPFILGALLATLLFGTSAAQQIIIQPDSIFKPTMQQLDSLRQLHPVVFSNKGCSRCTDAKAFLTKQQIPYVVLNIGIPENRASMYTFTQKASGGALTGIHYPVIVYRELTQYGQNDVHEFLTNLAEAIHAEKNPPEK